MKNITDYINEGLFSGFKAQAQITKAQAAVFTHFEKNQEKYGDDINKIKADLPNIAKKAYDKFVTVEGAMSYNDWYSDFSKAFLRQVKKNK